MKSYLDYLEHAEATGDTHDWAVVLAIEESYMLDRMPPGMREEGSGQLEDFLSRHLHCASCEARDMVTPPTAAVRIDQTRPDDDDDNLIPLCHICLYVLVARERGWPVRGCDARGYPNDPNHDWNKT